MSFCTLCQKTFKNSSSLASHTYKFHPSDDKSSNANGSNRKVLLPNPTFMDDNRKRSLSSYGSEESESDNNVKVKKIKIKKSINEESDGETISKLVRVVAKLIKDVNRIHTTFGKVAKDIDKAEDKIDENIRNISREITFKEMNGGGIDMEMKRFYQKIMDENPNLIKDVKETKKTVDAIQQHKFFKEYLKEDDKIKKNIMEMEECFINAMEIRKLFNDHDIDEMKFKIKKLQNAAQVAKVILELSEIESLMLKTIIYSSKIQVMDLLDEWFIYLRLIFDRLPSDEDLKHEAKKFAKEYKLDKEKESKNELGEDTDDQATETSESDSEDADDEASKESKSDNEDNFNDTYENSGTINESDEDVENVNDAKNSISKDVREVDDETSDISTKDDQYSTESVNESDS